MYLFDQNTTQNLLKECKFKNFEVFYKSFLIVSGDWDTKSLIDKLKHDGVSYDRLHYPTRRVALAAGMTAGIVFKISMSKLGYPFK